jgi:hypothetical protein
MQAHAVIFPFCRDTSEGTRQDHPSPIVAGYPQKQASGGRPEEFVTGSEFH